MTEKVELGVWGYEHFVLYLCAIVKRLHPTRPAGQLARILSAGYVAARNRAPRDLYGLTIDEPPSDLEKWNAIEGVAHAIIEVVTDCWLSSTRSAEGSEERQHFGIDDDEEWQRYTYNSARTVCLEAERVALEYLSYQDLAECAVDAFAELGELKPGPDERDAAVAAMTVGHYDVGLSILTRKDDE